MSFIGHILFVTPARTLTASYLFVALKFINTKGYFQINFPSILNSYRNVNIKPQTWKRKSLSVVL